MIFTSRDILSNLSVTKPTVFLAGSIDLELEGNWRNEIVEELKDDYHFFDPTRKEHNQMGNFEMQDHIKWELDALNMSNKILLNFLPDSKSPVSLIELGLYMMSSKLIVVCPKSFYKRRYIKTLCQKYNTELFRNLTEATFHLKHINL